MALHIDIKDHEFYLEGGLEKALTIGETMLLDKMLITQVAKFTKLTLEQVQALEKEINP